MRKGFKRVKEKEEKVMRREKPSKEKGKNTTKKKE